MSECPNCGSAEITFRYGKARWICGSHGHGADYFPHQTAICQLIWSLREELAAANQVIEGLEPLAKYYVEHKERCYDQMTKGKQGRTFARDSAIWARQQYNQALRNNEHRSNT